ncbi:MAG: EEP domain-containing protein, partial [Pseudomonadales bacterium]|nr:EEP domain-containing protein [Pseudomonadales bacterium]
MYEKLKQKLSQVAETLAGSAGREAPLAGFPLYHDRESELSSHNHIRLLTFNIQVGISTSAYRHYVTRSWQHVLPHSRR